MTYLRYLRVLRKVAVVLMRLPFKDRWGFNLGDDFYDWLSFKEMRYVIRINKDHEKRFVPVKVEVRCQPGKHAGTNYLMTWPPGIWTCDKCGPTTYSTGSVA